MRLYGIALALALAAPAAGVSGASAAEPASDAATQPPPTSEPMQNPFTGEDGSKRELSANPLWATSLRDLPATQKRPIFSPSRRPPAPPTLLAAPPAPATVVAAPREPDHPPLALVGTIVSETEQIAIFLEEATRQTTRLKAGEDYRGWSLRSVSPREVEFEGPNRRAVLVLPAPRPDATTGAATGSDVDVVVRNRNRKR